ncbi:MAG: hypothetical protein NDJ94_13720 [Vicinamibacteria bacterium]|nr:hypothetical protein [Vicinamibacteria bacterium]
MKATLVLGVFVGALALAASAEAGVSVGIGVALSDGHDRYDRGSGYGYGREGVRQARRYGYDRGFREGLEHGSSDSRKRRSFNYWHSSDYRNADDGYRRQYGPKPHYEAGFREGYEAGYRRGYARYGDRNRRDGGWDRGRYGDRDDEVIYEAPPRRW